VRALRAGGRRMSDITNGELPADADLDPKPDQPKEEK
jgi:hypothetical protein